MLSALGKLTSVVVPDPLCQLMGLPLKTRVSRSRQVLELISKSKYPDVNLGILLLEEIHKQRVFWPEPLRKTSEFYQRWSRLSEALSYVRIAHHFAKLNILSAAADAYEKALALYPFFVPARLELAAIKQKLSEHHVACRVLEEGVLCNPDVAALWTHLAVLQMHLGLSQRAENSFAKALDLYVGIARDLPRFSDGEGDHFSVLYAKLVTRFEAKAKASLHLASSI